MEVLLNVSSYGGIYAVSPKIYLTAAGTGECTCTGERVITTAFEGSSSPTPSPSKGSNKIVTKKNEGTTIDTKSALFIGLISAFSTLAAVGIVLGAMYFTGGLGAIGRSISGDGTLSRPLRRPTTRTDSGDPNAAITTGGEPKKIVTAAAGLAAAGTSSVAARRSAVIPPLDESGTGNSTAASAPSRPSPADGQQTSKSPGKTPPGAKRV